MPVPPPAAASPLYAQAWGTSRWQAAIRYAPAEKCTPEQWLLWDAHLSGCLIEEIRVLEVCLRNEAHDRLASTYGATWWTDPATPLAQKTKEKVTKAVGICKKHYTKETAPWLIADRVIPELSMGFWTALFGPGYTETLWEHALRHCFAKPGKRKVVHTKLQHITKMRNKIAHQELVAHRKFWELHRDIEDICGRLGREHIGLLRQVSRYDHVVAHRPRYQHPTPASPATTPTTSPTP